MQIDFCIIPTNDLKLETNMYLKLLKPLCGLSKSGHSWLQKYHIYFKEDLNLSITDGDMSFKFERSKNCDKLLGTIAVYVDDRLASCNQEYKEISNKMRQKFESKSGEYP